MAEGEDEVRRFVLYYKGSGMPNAEDISRIAGLRGVQLIDHELPRLALVEGPETSLLELMEDLPGWTIGPERLIKLRHPFLATDGGTMNERTEVVNPFDTYRVHYGTTNPNGHDLTRIEFFSGETTVGTILSGKAIAPGSFVTLRDGVIDLYFDSERLANALTILQGESNLALYFVPDADHPEREQGREGGICHQ